MVKNNLEAYPTSKKQEYAYLTKMDSVPKIHINVNMHMGRIKLENLLMIISLKRMKGEGVEIMGIQEIIKVIKIEEIIGMIDMRDMIDTSEMINMTVTEEGMMTIDMEKETIAKIVDIWKGIIKEIINQGIILQICQFLHMDHIWAIIVSYKLSRFCLYDPTLWSLSSRGTLSTFNNWNAINFAKFS
jgi:hypothetical protein